MEAGAQPQPYCLYRATDGKKVKVSTRVSAKDAAKFHPLYMSSLKVSMSALKKVEKAKKGAEKKKL